MKKQQKKQAAAKLFGGGSVSIEYVESRKNKGSLNLQVPKTSKKQPVGTMEYFVVHEFFTSLLKKPTGGKKTPTISLVWSPS